MFKATIIQTRFMLKQKTALITFYILLAMVLANFMGNVLAFQGTDIIAMYHPMKLLLLSYNRINWNADNTMLLVQLYPLLVAVPAGLSLARERQIGQDVLMASRMGNLPYRVSKLAAAFLTTMIVFTLPFLVELALNILSLPLNAQGDLSNLNIFSAEYISGVQNYPFRKLYLFSPYLYAILGTISFGLLSGLVAAATVALSSIVKVKVRTFLILPVFLFLYASVYLASLLHENGIELEAAWYHYFMLFDDEVKSPVLFVAVILILLVWSVVGTVLGGTQDCVQ